MSLDVKIEIALGPAKYNIKTKIITISQNCSLENYEDLSYIKEEIIREKIKKIEVSLNEMKNHD